MAFVRLGAELDAAVGFVGGELDLEAEAEIAGGKVGEEESVLLQALRRLADDLAVVD